MLSVAFAIRNRGTLKGVYGLKAPRIIKRLYSKETYEMAKHQWEISGNGCDITKGANHWENVKAFGDPYWAKSCTETVTIGSHNFYRC